jgi:Na+/melibiose symporter-like transporter
LIDDLSDLNQPIVLVLAVLERLTCHLTNPIANTEMIMANFVDRSLEHTGHRREGVYYSLLRVAGKLSKILESLALVLIGFLFGYVSGENPGPHPENAFRFLISVFPLIFTLIAWLISSKLSFDNKQMKLHTANNQVK